MKLAVLIFLLGMAANGMSQSDEEFFRLAGTTQYRPNGKVDIVPKVEIGKNGDTPLIATIFRPKNPPEGPMPAIVFIHGGGWRSGKSYNPFGAWLAERGYFVFSIDYRLTDKATWPAQIEDCKLGVRWLRAHADEYHIDPKRIGVFGTSAGGHLASCVGLINNVPELEGKGGFLETSSEVQAVAVFCPPTDFTGDWLAPGPYPAWVVALFGGTREEKPELWKQASPVTHIHAGAPPFFIAHGEADTHVPFTQGQKLKDTLEKAGVAVEWVPIKTGTHDFFVNPTTPESSLEPTREVVVQKLLAFFDRNLKSTP